MFWRFHWCAGTWGGRAHPVRDRGKTRSRHRRSRSCECRGSWGNTALLGRTGPDTPADTGKERKRLGEVIYTQTQALKLQNEKMFRMSLRLRWKTRANRRTNIKCKNQVNKNRDFPESERVSPSFWYWSKPYKITLQGFMKQNRKNNLKLDTVWKYLQEY